MKTRIANGTVIFLTFVLAGLPTVADRSTSKASQKDVSNAHDQYLSEIGLRLGGALSRDCSIFIGLVASVESQPSPSLLSKDQSRSLPTIHVVVNEYLWNDLSAGSLEVKLEAFPSHPVSPLYTHASPDGKDIEPQVGDRLLVVCYPDKNSEPGKIRISNYEMVLSDSALFQRIRETLRTHSAFTREPRDISALAAIDRSDDMVLCGYLVKYLWGRARSENAESQAPVLSKLLLNRRIPWGWFYVRMALNRILLDKDTQLSDSSRQLVAHNLIEAGESELQLAKQAIPILLKLTDAKLLDMRPFLNVSGRRALASNYQLLTNSGQIQGNHEEFQSQLRP